MYAYLLVTQDYCSKIRVAQYMSIDPTMEVEV